MGIFKRNVWSVLHPHVPQQHWHTVKYFKL